MDGKGAWRDNVFVERLWRSVKYEEVYLNAYEWCMMPVNAWGGGLIFIKSVNANIKHSKPHLIKNLV